MPTYVHTIAHSGAETISDQLSGTAVARVGPTGRVQAAFAAAKAENTARLYTAEGIDIIPDGSHPNIMGAADTYKISGNDFIYDVSGLPPGAELLLELVAAAASESSVAVRT